MLFQSSKISYVRGPANEGGSRGTYSQSTSCNISRFHRSDLDRSPWQIGLKSLLSDQVTEQKLTDSGQETKLRSNNQISISFLIGQEKRNCLFWNFTMLSSSCLIHTVVLTSACVIIYRFHNFVCSWPCITGHWASSIQPFGQVVHIGSHFSELVELGFKSRSSI